MTHTTKRRGFTIIELLVVIAIIGILTAILMPIIGNALMQSKKVQAANMVSQIEIALQSFHSQEGQFPWDPALPPPQTVTADVIRELAPADTRLTKGATPSVNRQLTEFLTIPKGALTNVPGGRTLVDPWNNEYMLGFDPDGQEALVWSRGPNGVDDTSDGDNNYGDDLHKP